MRPRRLKEGDALGNARVLHFSGCMELKVAVGGGVTLHGDRSKPGSAVDLFAGIGGWAFPISWFGSVGVDSCPQSVLLFSGIRLQPGFVRPMSTGL